MKRVLVLPDKFVDENQLSLIHDLVPNFKTWASQSIEIARHIPQPFYFSDLRQRLAVPPHHPNAWGSLAKMLLKSGFRRTGNYRKSPISYRKGGLDWEYERV